jgi:pimeloyl-ACP methyl ester carboxylesterase
MLTKREFLRSTALAAITVAAGSAVFMPGVCGAATPKGEVAKYPSVNYTDISPHTSGFAQVNGIKLNYLDWGGDGPPLVMIHGIGDDPHVFDDLASLLRDRFRIVAYARRGHGLSDSTGPYDSTTLLEDLRQLLDSLGIKRTRLIGWSMGGNEITAFAGRYPERVEKLVYLESGYDWSTPFFFKAFEATLSANNPTAADMESLDAARAWYRKAWLGNNTPWSPGLEAYLRDLAQPDADGKLHPKPTDEAWGLLLATVGSWQRDYAKVQAPALALYATTFFPAKRSDAALTKKLRDFDQKTMVPFRRASMERVKSELRNVKVQQIADRTHMSMGVQQPKALAAAIREFLLTKSGADGK